MPRKAGLLSSWSISGGVFSAFWGLPCSAGRQLSLTSGVNTGMSIGAIPWRTVFGASQGFEPFHVDHLFLLL